MGRETSLVLAIEPDSTKSEALRQLVRERLGVEIVLVSSPYAAIVAMNRQLPELVLFSSSLSDRNQNKIVAHYRSLTNGVDPQTLIIPLLRDGDEAKDTSRFSFRWKRQSRGSSSDVFLDTIASYLKRATPAVSPDDTATVSDRSVAAREGTTAESTPTAHNASRDFQDQSARTQEPAPEWQPAPATAANEPTPVEEAALAAEVATPSAPVVESYELVEDGEEVLLDIDPKTAVVSFGEVTSLPDEPVEAAAPDALSADDLGHEGPVIVDEQPLPVEPSVVRHHHTAVDDATLGSELAALLDQFDTDAIEVEATAETGADDASVDLSDLLDGESDTPAQAGVDPELHAAEIALLKLEAEEKLAAELERVRVEAVQQREVELARLQAEAEALRQATVAQARAAAEAEARDALSAELARVRAEAEQTVADALHRVRAEAEQTLSSEVSRAREEAETTRLSQIAEMEAAVERAREAAEHVRQSQLAEVQAAVERARAEAEQVRLTQLAEVQAAIDRAREEAEQVRRSQIEQVQAAVDERVDAVTRQAREVEAEAAQQRLAELARLQEEAEALRQEAVSRARAEVEAEARAALTQELARVRTEAEQTLLDALSRVRNEAEHTLTSEVSRVREQAEQTRSEELARIQAAVDERVSEATRQAREAAETEAARAFAEELARARAQAEATFGEELARIKGEAQRLATESERVRADAREDHQADVARAIEEAEALRRAAIAEARTAAEEAAARALEREVARVRSDAEARVQEEVERLRLEAEQVREHRSEAAVEAEKVREAARELERELARVRAEAESRVEQELERVRLEAEQAREAERVAARQEAEQLREAAAREAERLREAAAQEARAAAESALKSELERVRAESEARLAAEVTQLRAEADTHRTAELAELRTQLSQVRDAAAQQARSAAADAVAAEVARANKERAAQPPPRIEPPRPVPGYSAPGSTAPAGADDRRGFAIPSSHRAPAQDRPPVRPAARPDAPARPSRDVWTSTTPPVPALPTAAHSSSRAWGIGAAVAVLLIAAATASYNWLPVKVQITPKATETAGTAAPPVKESGKKAGTGELRIDTTPGGATILVDGRPRGQAPVALKGLSAGTHAVIFKTDTFQISRSVRVRADQTTTISQDMTAGFLSVFSRIPVEIRIDGRRGVPTDDGQVVVAPGTHTVRLDNARYNFRSEFSVEIKPGEVTAHTVMLPMGALLVSAEPGAEVFVEGERVGVAPLGAIAVPIGSREVVVKHATGAEARQTVDIVFGHQAEVSAHAAASGSTGALPVHMPPLSAPASPR